MLSPPPSLALVVIIIGGGVDDDDDDDDDDEVFARLFLDGSNFFPTLGAFNISLIITKNTKSLKIVFS